MFGLAKYELKEVEVEVSLTAAWVTTSLLNEKHKFLPSYVLIRGETTALLIYKTCDIARAAINAGVTRKFILTLASDRDIQELNCAFKHPFGGDQVDVRMTLALNLFSQQAKLVERYRALVTKLCGVTEDDSDIELISVKDISRKPAPFQPIVSTHEFQPKPPPVHCATMSTVDIAPLISAPIVPPEDSKPLLHLEAPSRISSNPVPWRVRKPRPWALDNASVNARFLAKYNAQISREEAIALPSDAPGLHLNVAGSSGNVAVSTSVGSTKVPPFRPVRGNGSAPSIPTATETKHSGQVAVPIPPFRPIRSTGVVNEKVERDGRSVMLPHTTPDDKSNCETNHRQAPKSWLRPGRPRYSGKRGRDDDTDEGPSRCLGEGPTMPCPAKRVRLSESTELSQSRVLPGDNYGESNPGIEIGAKVK